MSYARSKGFVGGLPTYDSAATILVLRSPCATRATTADVGETLTSILAEHRSAIALAQVQRWAHGQGALYGVPSFVQPKSKDTASSLEVILVHLVNTTPRPLLSNHDEGMPITSALTLAGI